MAQTALLERKPGPLLWCARALALLWVGFWLYFAIGSGIGEGAGAGGLVVHILFMPPALLFLAAFLLAWYRPRAGAIALGLIGVALAVIYLLVANRAQPYVLALLVGPPVGAAVLFWFGEHRE